MLISYAYAGLPVYPPTARLSVCPPDCPLLFFRQLSIAVSTAGCVSIHRLFVTSFDADCPPGQGVAYAGRGGPTVKNDCVLQCSRGYYVLCTNRPSPANRVLA